MGDNRRWWFEKSNWKKTPPVEIKDTNNRSRREPVKCRKCQQEFQPNSWNQRECPSCKSPGKEALCRFAGIRE